MSHFSWTIAGIFFLALGTSPIIQASENTPEKIIGSQIELFERAHSFAGSIAGTPVIGIFEESPFGAQVIIRKVGQSITFRLAEQGDHYSGDVIETQGEGPSNSNPQITTHVEFTSLKKTGPKSGEITLKIDQEQVVIKITGESFAGGHFSAPHFEGIISGKTVFFDFTGKACFGYSANLAMMIFGTYTHLNKNL